jgi:hypothetical protein
MLGSGMLKGYLGSTGHGKKPFYNLIENVYTEYNLQFCIPQSIFVVYIMMPSPIQTTQQQPVV